MKLNHLELTIAPLPKNQNAAYQALKLLTPSKKVPVDTQLIAPQAEQEYRLKSEHN
jgi:hypothetical protein